MRVENKTAYDTATLKRILLRVADEELDREERKKLRVDVEYHPFGRHAGRAWVGSLKWTLVRGGHMRMLVPRNEPVDPVTFAGIAAHEMAHARGVDHRTMKGAERYDWNAGDRRARYSWADEFIVLRKMALNDPGEERAKRLRHAEGKLKEARTRAKRAATLLKKWERRVARLS